MEQSNVWNKGRGRGYGRGKELSSRTKEPWKILNPEETKNPEKKMINMKEKYGNLLDSYEQFSSSSEDELDSDKIVDKAIKNYNEMLDGEGLSKDLHALHDILQSGALCCLVCIESIKRLHAIWSCTSCYSIFHLQCIQKWAREGIGRQAVCTEGNLSGLEFSWNCPKCRFEYKQKECPSKYICFCGKEEDPQFDPWTVPHSCGNRCDKPLKPECGHNCLLLCHPGACPPCPKTVRSTCHCGVSQPALKRCSQKEWSCGNVCNRPLPCNHHNCQEICHSGDCPTCPNTSSRPCMCGKVTAVKKCIEKEWSCQKRCAKALNCGHHTCEKECHSYECGDCPKSGKRKCPCGKTESVLPCTEDVFPCEDTCMKALKCEKHKCSKRCHYGNCETCLQVIEKTCRCGRKTKEVPCSQSLMCESKCSKTRNCGRHPCKKKCCDGNCPPCEQICNRTLNCGNHKCLSPCHQGMCYPCPLTRNVACFCGANKITTPCGKEKSVKPPKCKNICSIPPDCHHDKRERHRCHFGLCPACKFTCDKKLPDCDHTCPDTCHEKVRDKITENKNLLRGTKNKKKQNDYVFVSLPCQPCKQAVQKVCFGGHGVKDFPCFELKDFKGYSCTEECGRMLACENHVCSRRCHTVKGKPEPGKAGTNCQECEEFCTNPRPEGCIHDCKLPCHPGPCPKCVVHLKLSCHCNSLQVFLKCSEYHEVDESARDELLCCMSRCPKLMSCGHLCPKICHKGDCGLPDKCTEKKKVKCDCGRRKKDFSCVEVSGGNVTLDCDDRCAEVRNKRLKEKQEQEESEKNALLKKQQEELERFERKKQGRKRKQRNLVDDEEDEPSFLQKNIRWIIIFVVVTIFVLFSFKIFTA